ncbi:MAG: pentapeptide repeat-containing protein [Hyphomicrobiales bacterium]
MNREETLALYEQGVEAWNKWANEMLEERKKLEEAGEWKFKTESHSLTVPGNDQTKLWFEKSKADFSNADTPHKFKDHIDFSDFIFPGHTDFSNSIFFDTAIFDNCLFSHNTNFSDVIFKNFTQFLKATFKRNATFHDCIFSDIAIFTLTKFKKLAFFDNTEFNGTTYFINNKFADQAYFTGVRFNNKISFMSSKFLKQTSFENSEFNSQTDFCLAEFFSYADFESIYSKRSFSFEKAKFHGELPNLIQANFTEAPRLDNIKFGSDIPPGNFKNSITTFIHPDIKARYQALKRLAVQAHDHENEQRFWAGELRSDNSLRTEDGGWNLRPLVSAFWWGNIAYGCVSDYGRSIVRPIGALLILICLMTTLHLTASKTPLTYDKAFSAGYISANKSFLYLGTDPTKRSIIKEKYSALYGANENQTPKIPKTILTAEFVQTLLSAIFIFLALLGIRNNFKMK